MKYEYKYIVPVSQLDALREAINPWVKLDPYAAVMELHEYTVRSIYFDTPKFDYYYEKIDGYKIRKKIRIRGYNERLGDDIVFLEIKRKWQEPMEKRREKLPFELVRKLMKGDYDFDGIAVDGSNGLNGSGRFLYHLYSLNLKPVVLVIYDREAFFDRFVGDVRLTFDKNLRSVPYPGIDDLYDESAAKPAMKDHFIFEVKFRENFPFWLRPIIAKLRILKQPASKYVICVDNHRLARKLTKAGIHWKSTM